MYTVTEYDKDGFDYLGNSKLSGPFTYLGEPNRSLAVSMAANSINGKILIVAKHWVLVGSSTKRLLIHDHI